jgi:hypothetical protein
VGVAVGGRGVAVALAVGVTVSVGVSVTVAVFVADAPPTTPHPLNTAQHNVAAMKTSTRRNFWGTTPV